jgi:hypothetical protein
VLAAIGAGAVVVLVLGVLTITSLDNPTGRAAAAGKSGATPHPQSPSQSPVPKSPTPSSTSYAPKQEAAEWARTLEALDAQRAQAFWTLDVRALDAIYLPGSAPWSADRALLTAYRKQHIRVRGLRMHISTATVERRTATTITLRTVDHLTGGELVDRTGTKTPLPPGTPTTRLITLTTTPTTPTWRITTITSA